MAETLAFEATKIHFEDDEGYVSLAFGDDPMAPRDFVILTSDNEPSAQDKALGLDRVFVEGSGGLYGYGLVRAIALVDAEIRIDLDSAQAPYGCISVTSVTGFRDAPDLAEMVTLFQQRLAGD